MRRQQVLAELAKHPDKPRHAIFDPNARRDFVICTVAIRNVGVFEMRIPHDKYDPWVVLDAIQRNAVF
jgi:hypothetical protein